jgi:outer membrane protein TolC
MLATHCMAQSAQVQGISLLDAVGRSIAQNANVRLQQRQTDIARAALVQASSQFDPSVTASISAARDKLPTNSQQVAQYGVDALRTDTTTYGVRLGQQLRNGWTWGAGLSSTRTADTVGQLTDLPAQNLGRLDFTLLVPLGRGGGIAARAGEAIADLEAKAAGYDLHGAVAQNVLATVSAYWGLVAARKNLTLAREAESVLGQLRGEVEKLIAADERPASELTLITANLSDKVAQRIAAERAVLEAQQALGRAMGGQYEGYSAIVPRDDFPGPAKLEMWDAMRTARLIEMAMTKRSDLIAAQIRRDAARIGVEASGVNLRPRADLKVNLGYASLNEGNGASNTLWPYAQNQTGPNAGVSLTFEWPISNRASRSILEQQLAALDQRDVRVQELTNAVGSGVEAAVAGVLQAEQQLEAAGKGLSLYRQTVENERTKHRLGQSTLVEVLSVNDMLLAARAAYLSYQTSYLNYLAKLRFETGTLMESSDGRQTITMDQLVSAPQQSKP